jgi:hypothetical protein
MGTQTGALDKSKDGFETLRVSSLACRDAVFSNLGMDALGCYARIRLDAKAAPWNDS